MAPWTTQQKCNLDKKACQMRDSIRRDELGKWVIGWYRYKRSQIDAFRDGQSEFDSVALGFHQVPLVGKSSNLASN